MSARWALVTGATGAVGGESTRALAAAGLGVVVHGRRAETVQAAVDELSAQGAAARGAVFDLGDRARVRDAIAELAGAGVAPTVLVNAAAEFGPLVSVDALDPADWDRITAVNLTAVLDLARELVPGMRRAGWGRLVQVSSAAAVAAPGAGNTAYSVTKAAANRLLGHLAAELVGTGVTVHALHPGEIASRMWEHVRDESSGRPELHEYARWAEQTGERPEDVRMVGRMLTALLGDETARRLHGMFVWAQQPDRAGLPLS